MALCGLSGWDISALSGGGDERNLYNRDHNFGATDYLEPYFLALGGESVICHVELERQKFSESFEYHMGFKPDEYPDPEVVKICMGIWKSARQAGGKS